MGNKQKKHGWLWWVLVVLWWLYIGWWWRPLLWLIRYFKNRNADKSNVKPSTAASFHQPPVQSASRSNTVAQTVKTERHKVAGISFRTDNLLTLGTKNSAYDLSKSELVEQGLTNQRIYRTNFYVNRCELVPEPENPHDSKAIKVVANGVHIGYIKKGSCANVHKLLRENLIQSVQCEIGGGKYKIVLADYDEDGDSTARIESDTIPYFAVVSITQKP